MIGAMGVGGFVQCGQFDDTGLTICVMNKHVMVPSDAKNVQRIC